MHHFRQQNVFEISLFSQKVWFIPVIHGINSYAQPSALQIRTPRRIAWTHLSRGHVDTAELDENIWVSTFSLKNKLPVLWFNVSIFYSAWHRISQSQSDLFVDTSLNSCLLTFLTCVLHWLYNISVDVFALYIYINHVLWFNISIIFSVCYPDIIGVAYDRSVL